MCILQQLESNRIECSRSDAFEGQEGVDVHVHTTGLRNGVYSWMWCILLPMKGLGDGTMGQARRLNSKALRGGRFVAEVNEVSV